MNVSIFDQSDADVTVTTNIGEVHEIVMSIICRVEKLISMKCPYSKTAMEIKRAIKFNNLLIKYEYNHICPELFEDLTRKAKAYDK